MSSVVFQIMALDYNTEENNAWTSFVAGGGLVNRKMMPIETRAMDDDQLKEWWYNNHYIPNLKKEKADNPTNKIDRALEQQAAEKTLNPFTEAYASVI